MRILVVRPGPHFSVADVCNGWIKGLRQTGNQVVDFNFDDRLDFYTQAELTINGETKKAFDQDAAVRLAAKGLQAALYEFWPDVVVVISGFFIPPETMRMLRKRPHHMVLVCTESPYEDDRQLERAQFYDTVLLNDPTNIEKFRAVNPRTWYVPHAYDPEVHCPGPIVPELKSDFVFVGTGYESRINFFEQVDWSGIDALFGGMWQSLDEGSVLRQFLAHPIEHCLDNADTVRAYRSGLVSANLYRKEAERDEHVDGWAMGPREVELAACGTFFIRESRPESDEIFPMLPKLSEPAEFGDLVRWWIAHPNEREHAAQAAHDAIVNRTFGANASWLLNQIEG